VEGVVFLGIIVIKGKTFLQKDKREKKGKPATFVKERSLFLGREDPFFFWGGLVFLGEVPSDMKGGGKVIQKGGK